MKTLATAASRPGLPLHFADSGSRRADSMMRSTWSAKSFLRTLSDPCKVGFGEMILLLLAIVGVSLYITNREVANSSTRALRPLRILAQNQSDTSEPVEQVVESGLVQSAGELLSNAPSTKVAICTSIKQEQPDDMAEWVQYYKWLGVDNIGIIENSVNVTAALAQRLAPHVDSGFLRLQPWGDDEAAQKKAFAKCFEEFRHTHDWVAFFDSDEYLMLLERGANLQAFLDEYKEYPALAVNWITFGANGRKTRPKEGGMLRWYTQCREKPHTPIKVIVNSKHADPSREWPHPHNMYYKDHTQAVAEDFEPIKHTYGEKCIQNPQCEAECRKDCEGIPGWTYHSKEVKRIALFHYATKSWEDFENKMARGGGNSKKNAKTPEYFDKQQVEMAGGGVCDEGVHAWTQCCS